MSTRLNPSKENEAKNSDEEEKKRQLQRIHRLASRLPWIVMAISLFAFAIIFLLALYRY